MNSPDWRKLPCSPEGGRGVVAMDEWSAPKKRKPPLADGFYEW